MLAPGEHFWVLGTLKLSDNVLRGIWQVGFKSRKAYRVNSIGEGYTSPPANILETAVVFYFFFLTSSSYEVLMRFLSGSYEILIKLATRYPLESYVSGAYTLRYRVF